MRPPPLIPGKSTLAVIAPASPPKDIDALERGFARLRSRGYRLKTGRSFNGFTSYLCGSDEERAAEFNRCIADEEVHGILCVRGGYGVLRILSLIDYEAARHHPKLVVGYSDISALQLALYACAGLSGISGPMVGVDWPSIPSVYETQFWELAGGFSGSLGGPLERIRDGEVEGTLLGGNLTVLTRLIGTPYLPSLEGAILFLEDINEPPYRVDAMLAHLKLAGLWDQLGGLVLGQFTDEESPQLTSQETAAVLEEYCKEAPFPVASNLLYGHLPAQWAIPQGVRARLTVDISHTNLTVLEPVVELPSLT